MTVLERLGAEPYVVLTTFRKDGRAVPTPVWVVRDGDALAVWTVADSAKVKRIRRNAEVTLTPCDRRGKVHGDAVPGHATVAPPAENSRVRKLLSSKYGLTARVITWVSRWRRGAEGTVVVRIQVAD